MSLGITIQPVDADTAQSLPALAYLLLPEVWANEIDLGEYRGQPEPPVLEAVAHLLTSLNGYLHECASVVPDEAARATLTGTGRAESLAGIGPARTGRLGRATSVPGANPARSISGRRRARAGRGLNRSATDDDTRSPDLTRRRRDGAGRFGDPRRPRLAGRSTG